MLRSRPGAKPRQIRQLWRSKVNIGPFAYDGVRNSGTINVTIVVQDTAGHQVLSSVPLTYSDCVIVIG